MRTSVGLGFCFGMVLSGGLQAQAAADFGRWSVAHASPTMGSTSGNPGSPL